MGSTTVMLIIIILCVILSGYFSATETAFSSINRVRLKNQAEKGGLKDYSNRQWSGLIGDFYKARWQRWITARTNELSGTDYESNIDWFEWEWEWVRSNKEYPTTATPQDLKTLGAEILENYSVKNPAANDEFDLPTEGMTATAGSAQPQTGKEGPHMFWIKTCQRFGTVNMKATTRIICGSILPWERARLSTDCVYFQETAR